MNSLAKAPSGAFVLMAAVAALLSPARDAHATVQIKDLQDGVTVDKPECIESSGTSCTVDLKFRIVNTGFTVGGRPDKTMYMVTSVVEAAGKANKFGDYSNDILAKDTVTQNCVGPILKGMPCDVTATFEVADNDVADKSQTDNEAKTPDAIWDAYIFVDVATPKMKNLETVMLFHPVGILDDDTPQAPEPSTWALMIMGFAGVGAGVRRRRAAPA